MSKAQGQFTITDYNDALTLTGFINSNLAKTQMYNPDNDTYTPSWASTNLVLTPSLYVMGTTADKITATEVTSVKWYDGAGSTAITSGGSYALSGTKSHILTIKGNVMAGLPGKDYVCAVTYQDPTTGMVLTHKMSISFSRVVNGGGIVDLLVTTPNGNVFKNQEVASLTAKAELWRGSAIDTTNVTYQWYMQDSSATADQGGGVGWKKLTETAGMYTGVISAALTIYSAAVASYGVFKCIAKDTDSASNTYNKTFIDVAAFIDNSDPLQIYISSTGGNVFKNGEGSTILTAKVFQAGEEIDSGGKGTYKWTKYDKSGTLVTSFNKTGKTLTVGDTSQTPPLLKTWDGTQWLAVNDYEIGARNLLLHSNTPRTSTDYTLKTWLFGNEKPVEGETYTFTMKGALGNGKTRFSIYNTDGSTQLAVLSDIGNGLYRAIFKWLILKSSNTSLRLYAMPSAVVVESTVEWAKLEKGNKATDWTPAPEDTDAAISKVEEVTKTNSTNISAANGKIETLITENTTRKGETTALNTKYSQIEQTVDGLGVTIGNVSSKADTNETQITAVKNKQTTFEATLDGINGKVTENTENISTSAVELQGLASQLNQTAQSILMSVEATYSKQSDLDNITNLLKTNVEILNNLIEFKFTTASSQTDAVENLVTSSQKLLEEYIRFQGALIQLGKTGSSFTAELSNEDLAFMQDGKKIAFISNNKLYITDVEIKNKLSFGTEATGYFDFVPRKNGNLSIKWRAK